MIEIARIDHMAMATPDLDAQVALFEGLFGFRRESTRDDDRLGARRVRFAIPGEQGLRWEILSPLRDDSPVQAFLDSPRGPGLRHVALEVPDLDAVAQALNGHSIDPVRTDGVLTIEADRGGEGITFELLAAGSAPAGNSAGMEAAGEHALGVIAFDHVSHGYRNRDELCEWYERVFGMKQIWRTPDDSGEDFADLVMEIPGQSVVWEIIMPQGAESFIQRFLDTRGPTVHHVAFQVADWERALAACEHHGVPILDISEGETDGGRWADTFIHPKHTGGVLVQFFYEEKPATWIRSDKIRPPSR